MAHFWVTLKQVCNLLFVDVQSVSIVQCIQLCKSKVHSYTEAMTSFQSHRQKPPDKYKTHS